MILCSVKHFINGIYIFIFCDIRHCTIKEKYNLLIENSLSFPLSYKINMLIAVIKINMLIKIKNKRF